MRIPPATRTWGIDGAEIVIRQSRPIAAAELFEHFDWRGMELYDGYLMPKGAELSHEKKQLEFDLCARSGDKLEGYLAGYADYLLNVKTEKQKGFDVGYIVCSHSKLEVEHDDDLKRWFAWGYREIWVFWPWYRTLYVYTSPLESKQINGNEFASPYLTSGSGPWKLPLNEIFED